MSPLIITLRRLIIRPLAVQWSLFRGIVSFRLGRLSTARGHFRRVLDLEPDHFRARVLLGRIHFHFLEVSEGLAHLSYARRLDPLRFRRAGLDEYFKGYDLDWGIPQEKKEAPLFANFRSEPDAASPGMADSWEFDSMMTNSLPPETLLSPDPARPGRTPGDFSSPQEYGRFKDLPPITRDEIEEIDWNEVSSDLFD